MGKVNKNRWYKQCPKKSSNLMRDILFVERIGDGITSTHKGTFWIHKARSTNTKIVIPFGAIEHDVIYSLASDNTVLIHLGYEALYGSKDNE